MSRYMILDRIDIVTTRMGVESPTLWNINGTHPSYIEPNDFRLYIELEPINRPSPALLEAISNKTLHFAAGPIAESLSYDLSNLVKRYGKDAVAVMLDSLLEKL